MTTSSRIVNEIHTQFPYIEPRPRQKGVINKALIAFLQSKKKFFAIESPTGSGKSGMAYTIAKALHGLEAKECHGPHSIVATRTRALQIQYAESFSDTKRLWSSKHFTCNLYPTDEEAYYGSYLCKKKDCEKLQECDYLRQKSEFLDSPIGVLNNAFIMHSPEFNPVLLVLDECHNLDVALCDIMSVKLSRPKIRKLLLDLYNDNLISEKVSGKIIKVLDTSFSLNFEDRQVYLKLRTILAVLRNLLVSVTPELIVRINTLKISMDIEDPTVRAALKILDGVNTSLNSLLEKLDRFLSSKVNWIISTFSKEEEFFILKPIEVHELASDFFDRADYVLFMSATICGVSEFMSSLGIGPDEYEFISLDSTFPVENRKIIPLGLPGMNYRNKEELLPTYVQVIDAILAQFTEQRGIIHTISYDNAEYIAEHSTLSKRMVIPRDDDLLNLIEILKRRKNTVIVSPAITEGLDLEGDLSRFQIFLKFPYSYLGDKWVAAKKDLSNAWYIREGVIKLIQGSGRSIRSADDWATTFILDGNFDKVLQRNSNLFPKWYLSSITTE